MIRRVLRGGDMLLEFVEPGQLAPGRPGKRLEFVDLRAATTWLARFLADPQDAACLRRLAGDLARGAPLHDDGDVLARIAAALVTRRLVLAQRTRASAPVVAVRAREDEPRAEPRGPGIHADHWIEVQLLDEAGAGVPGQRCQIVTSDRHVHTGYTDATGVARWTRLAPGVCAVCFPELDAGGWQKLRTVGP